MTAVGNIPNRMDPGGSGKIPVCTAYDVFAGKAVPGRDVVVIGGGAVGCECADVLVKEAALSPEQVYFMLSQRSETPEKVLGMIDKTRRKVTIIDVAKIGTGFEQGTAWPLMKDLARFGVEQYSFAKLLDVTDSTVEIEAVKPKTREQKAKERETGVVAPEEILRLSIPCDTIVTAVGAKPNTALYDALKEKGVQVYNIGDSNAVGKVSDAIAQAAELIREIK